ncbi:MAG TPA: hypothetical protein VF544_13720 [Pyrinomonadaceae bacterium]|jgi:hypothetical protein
MMNESQAAFYSSFRLHPFFRSPCAKLFLPDRPLGMSRGLAYSFLPGSIAKNESVFPPTGGPSSLSTESGDAKTRSLIYNSAR